jgi:hypothetical protein
MAVVDDFFEDDEPVGEVVAAFERGRTGVTGRPSVVVVALGLELNDRGSTTGVGGKVIISG